MLADTLGYLPALRRTTSTFKAIVCICSALGTFLLLISQLRPADFHHKLPSLLRHSIFDPTGSFSYEDRGGFNRITVKGFDNTHQPGIQGVHNLTCSELHHFADIGVQNSFFMTDDKMDLALTLDDHPMVDYSRAMLGSDEKNFKLARVIEHSWDRLANACVLLKKQDVYLCVTRVIFLDSGRRDKARISFLRGQIFDKTWSQIEGYTVKWKDQEITFPRVFDIETEYTVGGHVYGPEDPRILIEDDVPDAEPVIVFNMLTRPNGMKWARAMWIHRPFSGHTTVLTIRGQQERRSKEKNWTPLFISDHHGFGHAEARNASTELHFAYSLEPLKIFKCSLQDGMCDTVFEQQLVEETYSPHGRDWSFLRGGTQFVPIPMSKLQGNKTASQIDDGVRAYFSIARTHAERTPPCKRAVYRPEFIVMITNGTNFYLTYGSGPIDFGKDAVMDAAALNQPCGAGRIMIPNGIADWDLNARVGNSSTDVMTLTLSVDDSTTQVIRISGVMSLLSSVPSLKLLATSVGHRAAIFDPHIVEDAIKETRDDHYELLTNYSAVGWDVRACVEEAARRYVEYPEPF